MLRPAEIHPPAEVVGGLPRYAYMARFDDAGFGPNLASYFDRAGRLAGDNLERRLILPNGFEQLQAGCGGTWKPSAPRSSERQAYGTDVALQDAKLPVERKAGLSLTRTSRTGLPQFGG